jgi:hypothetical protein
MIYLRKSVCQVGFTFHSISLSNGCATQSQELIVDPCKSVQYLDVPISLFQYRTLIYWLHLMLLHEIDSSSKD